MFNILISLLYSYREYNYYTIAVGIHLFYIKKRYINNNNKQNN